MPYSQKQLIDLIKKGGFLNETTVPKHIETVISNLFIFEDKVYKIYKDKKFNFTDNNRNLTNKIEKFNFTEKDFNWNKNLSPMIHLDLMYVSIVNNNVVKVKRSEADELIIVMKRIKTENILYESLIGNKITKQNCFTIGKQLAEKVKMLQTNRVEGVDFYDKYYQDLKDLEDWMLSASDLVPINQTKQYCDYLKKHLEVNKSWFKTQSDNIIIIGDFHIHNALFLDDQLFFIDTYPPLERWGLGHKHFPIYRIGVDIWALSGQQEYFESFINGYESICGEKIDRSLDNFWIIHAAGIAMPYLYMLSRTDSTKIKTAEKYNNFVKEYFHKIIK